MPLNIGDPAPQFTGTDVITGNTHSLSDYAGQVVLLCFSGPSWCPPCKFEAPILVDLWDFFGGLYCKPKTQFLMVSCFTNETPAQFKTAVEDFGITFPALLNPNLEISNKYEVSGVPQIFIIGPDQKICNMHGGAGGDPEVLYEHLYNMLVECGSCTKSMKLDVSRWAAAVTILFGVTQDGGGLVITPGGKPIPIDPWGPLKRMSADKRNVLMNLAISEMTKSLEDRKTAGLIGKAALKSAEASMRKLASAAQKQAELPEGSFSKAPKK